MKKIPWILTILIVLSAVSGCVTNPNDQNHSQLPDSDDDGVPDTEDAFPDDPSEQYDLDSDGVGDNNDAFPTDPAASVDSDNDTFPEFWNSGKNQSASTTGLKLDEFPNDPTEWQDSDGDGIGDNSDIAPNVDLAVNITLNSFTVTTQVDPFPIHTRAQVYFEIHVNNRLENRIDNGGWLWRVWINDKQDIDQVFKYNIDDHKDNRYTTIEIIMYDNDIFGEDIIDISNNVGENTLVIQYDAEIGLYSGVTQGQQGKLWYEITSAKVEYNKTYTWSFNNRNWEVSLQIPAKTYTAYRTTDVNRNPQSIGSRAMAAFVTSDDPVIVELANLLKETAESENFTDIITANFVLRFVQYLKYSEDNASVGPNEYWRYPVETLVDETGDCEDTSVLFASLMEAMGYDAVLLLYVIEKNDEDIGHLAAGLHVTGGLGDQVLYAGKEYFYCETTTRGYNIGVASQDYKGETPEIIVPVH